MPWLTVNGIELKKLVALSGDPAGARRDIGDQSQASDGFLRVTRQTRKRDFKFTTVPLTGAEAFSWESFLVGEGHVWSFDSHFYSSKGLAGTGSVAPPNVEVQASIKKFGAGALKVVSGETWQTTDALALAAPWTMAVWARGVTVAPTWHHYVERYDGTTLDAWLDGVRQAPATNFDDLFTAVLPYVILKTDYLGEESYFDDLVICPYLWADTWPAQVFAAGRAFGPLPYLTAIGDLVREATTRQMVCSSLDEKVVIAGLDGELQRDARVLSVELKGA